MPEQVVLAARDRRERGLPGDGGRDHSRRRSRAITAASTMRLLRFAVPDAQKEPAASRPLSFENAPPLPTRAALHHSSILPRRTGRPLRAGARESRLRQAGVRAPLCPAVHYGDASTWAAARPCGPPDLAALPTTISEGWHFCLLPAASRSRGAVSAAFSAGAVESQHHRRPAAGPSSPPTSARSGAALSGAVVASVFAAAGVSVLLVVSGVVAGKTPD
jgi:hypothetical protein